MTTPESIRASLEPGLLAVDPAPKCFWARKSNYALATGVIAMGLGLRFYYVQELLTQLALFSLLFFAVSLAVLSAFLICYAAKSVGGRTVPASRVARKAFLRLAVAVKKLRQTKSSGVAAGPK